MAKKLTVGDLVAYTGPHESDHGPKIGSIGVIIRIEKGVMYVVHYDGQPNVNGVNGAGLWTTDDSSIRAVDENVKIRNRIEELERERDKIDMEIESIRKLLPQDSEEVKPAIRHLDLDD